MKQRNHIDDLRGASRLAVEATKAVTDLVQAMHEKIAGPFSLFALPAYLGVRGVAALVGAGIDVALGQLAPLVAESAAGPQREAVVAALNGVLGDYLESTNNPLAVQMRFRRGGVPLELTAAALRTAIPDATAKLLVLVHGSSMNDLQWRRSEHELGESLARLGYTPVHLHYNSGRHISTNGRDFAALLEELAAAWPAPLESVTLLCHSMGGLVARSACHAAGAAGHRWREKLRHLVFLGSPHHGAPLEQYGALLNAALGISSYSAPFTRLGKIRSAGVTDLRYGNVRDEDWQGRDRHALGSDERLPLPLPEGVRCFAVAGTLGRAPGGALLGDGLVQVDSALGRCTRPELTLAFPPENQLVVESTDHLGLLARAAVREAVERWLT
jgi:hypothetical protein